MQRIWGPGPVPWGGHHEGGDVSAHSETTSQAELERVLEPQRGT